MTAPTSQKRRRKVKASLEDDTPRAFKRLFDYTLKGRRPPSGLDDNPEPPSKKRKRTTEISTAHSMPASRSSQTQSLNTIPEPPKILPSESLSAFGARVDAALPVSGLARAKRGKGPEMQGERQTKMERKMQRMQNEWRENDRKRRERAEEEDDANVMEDDDMGATGMFGKSRRAAQTGNAKAKKNKKKHGNSESAQSDLDEADPWAAVARKRAEHVAHPPSTGKVRGRSLVGLHDVVLAPPKLLNMSRAKIKAGVRGPGAESGHVVKPSVPGLRRQAELSAARREVIEGYRQMMRERRGGEE